METIKYTNSDGDSLAIEVSDITDSPDQEKLYQFDGYVDGARKFQTIDNDKYHSIAALIECFEQSDMNLRRMRRC